MCVSSAAPKSVSQRTGSSSSIVRAPSGPEHGEAVVLAGDLGAAGGQVLDRVVGAVVAERQLVGLEADGAAEQLVAEADPVDGQLADQLAHGRDDVVERRRVAGAVGQEDRVGIVGQSARRRSPCTGCSSTVAPALAQVAHDRELDAGVDHRDPRARRRRLSGARIDASGRGARSRARSRPVIAGSARSARAPRPRRCRAGKTPPRIAPASRMWRTSARVSRSVIAGTPQSASQLSQPPSAPGASSRSIAGAHDRRAGVDPVGLHRLAR